MLPERYKQALRALKDQAAAAAMQLDDRATGKSELADAQRRMSQYPDEVLRIASVVLKSKSVSIPDLTEAQLVELLDLTSEVPVAGAGKGAKRSMLEGVQVVIGGLDLTNSAEGDPLLFKFPNDRPIGCLLDGHVTAALAYAIDGRVGLMSLPSVGSTDACLDFQHLRDAIADIRANGGLSEETLGALEKILDQWSEVPHAGVGFWWNKTPNAFDVPVAVGFDGIRDNKLHGQCTARKSTVGIEDIDPSKAITLTAHQHELDRPISGPVSGLEAIVIQGEDVVRFLAWAKRDTWREMLEDDFQCVACDRDNIDLWSAYIPLVTFREEFCTGGRSLQDELTQALMERLRAAMRSWREAGADTVNVDVYPILK